MKTLDELTANLKNTLASIPKDEWDYNARHYAAVKAKIEGVEIGYQARDEETQKLTQEIVGLQQDRSLLRDTQSKMVGQAHSLKSEVEKLTQERDELKSEFRTAKNSGCDATCLNYRDGDDEITSLKSALASARECIEFYGEVENWSLSEKHTKELNEGSKHAITGGYTRIWDDHSDGGINLIGGKRAREWLAKHGNKSE